MNDVGESNWFIQGWDHSLDILMTQSIFNKLQMINTLDIF